MHRSFMSLLAFVTFIGAAGQSIAEGELRQITGVRTIRAIFADRTVYGTFSDASGEWIEYHSPDGQTAYFMKNNNCFERGEWWVTERHICYRYPDTQTQDFCFVVLEQDGRYGTASLQEDQGWDPNRIHWADAIQSGNPEKLPLGLTTCGLS